MKKIRHTDNKFTVAIKRILKNIKHDPKVLEYKRLWAKTWDVTEEIDNAWMYVMENEGRSFNPMVLAGYITKAVMLLNQIVPELDRVQYSDSIRSKRFTRRKRYADMSYKELREYAFKKMNEASKLLYDASATFWTFDHNKYKAVIPSAKAALQDLIGVLKKNANSLTDSYPINRFHKRIHNDSAFDVLFAKLKEKAAQIKDDFLVFKDLPFSKKVVVLISQIIRVFADVSAARTALSIPRAIKTINQCAKRLESVSNEIDMKFNKETGSWEMSGNGKDYKIPARKLKVIMLGIKGFIVLVKLLVATLAKLASTRVMNKARSEKEALGYAERG